MRKHILALASALLFVFSLAATPAFAKPPIEAFGDLPTVRAAALSPAGRKLAYIRRSDGDDMLVVHDFEANKSRGLVRIGELRARGVMFAGEEYVVVLASRTVDRFGPKYRWEASGAYAINLASGKISQLLANTFDLYPAQGGLGRILAVDPDGIHVYMAAFMGRSTTDPTLDLLKVSLENGRGVVHRKGQQNTVEWLVSESGEALAREDFSEKRKAHEIRIFDGGLAGRTIFSDETDFRKTGLMGLAPAGDKLVTTDLIDSEFVSLYEMSRDDGAINGPLMQRNGADIEWAILDKSRRVLGVQYSGMQPSYDMFDDELEKAIAAAQAAYPNASVSLESWSDDWSRMLFLVSGGDKSERYVLLDRAGGNKLNMIATLRPDIKPTDVGEVFTIQYKARDGLIIPALVTWPAGIAADARKSLPLIVLPHGGPEAYDGIGFDWLAQFLANEGYMVLQPNFRGSAGFGASFRSAGHGQWGRKMQDDITDGVNAVAKMGWADSKRTCIVGWSYGGYAALAGGGLTPELYKCVVSIAGVSDLGEMLRTEKRGAGARSQSYSFWTLLIGDPDKDKDAIDAVSPARLADRFQAPVLLIHGTEDLVVEASQSDRMADALKKAGKPVQYIKIRGDDHGLVSNESRREALMALAAFLKTHLQSDDRPATSTANP